MIKISNTLSTNNLIYCAELRELVGRHPYYNFLRGKIYDNNNAAWGKLRAHYLSLIGRHFEFLFLGLTEIIFKFCSH